MCLATVYKDSDDTVICRNVSKLTVEEDTVIIRDIMGDETAVKGRILMVDLANSIVKLICD
ncbi:MAG: CooT family nickel-binding protein [Oliverpabstia sp.]